MVSPPQPAKPRKGIVVSDFHLGLPGSVGHKHLNAIKAKIVSDEVELCVLNGDMIEAKEIPTGSTAEKIIDRYFPQIENLVSMAKGHRCKVVITEGNHEIYPYLTKKFRQLEEKYPGTVEFHDSFKNTQHIQENAVFLHGHVHYEVVRKGNWDQLKKALKGELEVKPGHHDPQMTFSGEDGKAAHTAHPAAITFKTIASCKLGKIMSPMKKIGPAIVQHLKNTVPPEQFAKLDTVFMGHLHYDGYKPREVEFEGKKYTFHVTGAPIKFAKNTMLEFDIGGDGRISNAKPFGTEKSNKIKR
jgi:Calcineurin-like phosphoesterase